METNFFLKLFCLLKLFDIFLCQENNNNQSQIKILNLDPIINTIFNNLTNDNNSIISEECRGNLSKYYKFDDSPNQEEVQKLYEGSSKGFIDLSSFYNCDDINNKNNSNNKSYNFYTIYPKLDHHKIIHINEFNEEAKNQHFWIFGFCLIDRLCNEIEIKNMFIAINQKFKEYNMTIFDDTYYNDTNHINVIDNRKKDKDLTDFNSFDNILNLFPAIFIGIQILFLFLKIIPVKIFGCCIKLKYRNEFKKNPNTISKLLNTGTLDIIINLKIKEFFSISESFYDLVYKKKNDELYQEDDLTYIKGIRGIGIVFLIFGTTYIYFINYPICITENSDKIDFMKSPESILLNIFWRIAPALLLSTSGYSLSYKFLNFLDKKLVNTIPENAENKYFNFKDESSDSQKYTNIMHNQSNNYLSDEGSLSKENSTKLKTITISNSKSNKEMFEDNEKCEIVKKEEMQNIDGANSNTESYFENTLGVKFYDNDIAKIALNQIFKNQRVNDVMSLSKIPTYKIPISIFFNFFFRQIHKILLLILGIHFGIDFSPIIFPHSPLMNYFFIEKIDKLKNSYGYFFYFENLVEMFESHGHEGEISFLNIYSILVCEINFYIIGTILIFCCYKNKLRLDRIIYLLLIIFTIIKIVYIIKKEECNPAMFYFNSVYQRFFFNPIFNFNYYIIGILFGMVNYVIQNGISNNEDFINKRPMLNLCILLSEVCDYKKGRNIIHYICCIIFLFVFLVIFPILFKIKFDDNIINNSPSTFFKIISSIDIDCFLYLFHFFMMSCYISGRNLIFNFFNSNIWSQLSKLYFCFIIFSQLACYYILYSAEMKFQLGFGIISVYTAICLINLYIICFFYYIILELPYKKLIKLYFNINIKINKSHDDDEDDDEESYPLQKESCLTEMVETFVERDDKN